MTIILGILIPFFGTSLGALMVYVINNNINKKIEKVLLSFAAGVMIASAIWSLIMPSIDMAIEQNIIAWIPASIGVMCGIFFLNIMDKVLLKLKEKNNLEINKSTLLTLAVTLHNIPEGMAVGVAFAGAIVGNVGISMTSAFILAAGIAIQNIPEGTIISMPLKSQGMKKSKAFLVGVLSGIVEPIFAVITIVAINFITPILPFLLSFAAGAMISVVVKELIPESQEGEYSNLVTSFFAIGFCIMMILDVALG